MIWPTSSWSSAAIRLRSASCAASARRPLSLRSDSSRSSISLNERIRPATSRDPLGLSRPPGRSRSTFSIRCARRSSGLNTGRSNA